MTHLSASDSFSTMALYKSFTYSLTYLLWAQLRRPSTHDVLLLQHEVNVKVSYDYNEICRATTFIMKCSYRPTSLLDSTHKKVFVVRNLMKRSSHRISRHAIVTYADESRVRRSSASVCVPVCLSVRAIDENGWNYNNQTCHMDCPSWVFSTHLILGQKVKVKVTWSQSAKTYFSWRRVSGQCEFALYRVPRLSFHQWFLKCVSHTAHVIDTYRLSVCLSVVCPSVKRWYCVETAQPIVKLSSLPGSSMILVFWGPNFFQEFQWKYPNGGVKCKG